MVRSRPPACGCAEQVIGEERMQVQDGVTVEADLAGLLHEQFNGGFMIEDHLRIARAFALGALAQRQEPLGLEQRVGIALEAAGVPGKVDK